MYIKKSKLKEIMNNYPTIVDSDDVEAALYFVRDLLEAEAEATKQAEPHATITVADMEKAANTIGDLIYNLDEVEDDE